MQCVYLRGNESRRTLTIEDLLPKARSPRGVHWDPGSHRRWHGNRSHLGELGLWGPKFLVNNTDTMIKIHQPESTGGAGGESKQMITIGHQQAD